MRSILLALVLLFVPACTTVAQGDLPKQVFIGAACMTMDAVRTLAAEAAMSNGEGYLDVMNDPTVPCYDARMHPHIMTAGLITVVERIFNIVREDGRRFQFWRAEHDGGRIAYVWTYLHGEDT